MIGISLFQQSRSAALHDGQQVEVLGVTKGEGGVGLWVVRRTEPDGESVIRCYEFVRFAELSA